MTGGWRDMSTAPRDGTVVLGRFGEQPGDEPARGDGRIRVLFDVAFGSWVWEARRRQRRPLFETLVREPDGWRPLGGTP